MLRLVVQGVLAFRPAFCRKSPWHKAHSKGMRQHCIAVLSSYSSCLKDVAPMPMALALLLPCSSSCVSAKPPHGRLHYERNPPLAFTQAQQTLAFCDALYSPCNLSAIVSGAQNGTPWMCSSYRLFCGVRSLASHSQVSEESALKECRRGGKRWTWERLP